MMISLVTAIEDLRWDPVGSFRLLQVPKNPVESCLKFNVTHHLAFYEYTFDKDIVRVVS